jgi:membrane-associated phospholipid phosphatase
MTIIEENPGVDLSMAAVDHRAKRWDGRLARAISNVGSPPVLTALMMGLTASTLPEPGAWGWAGAFVLVAVLTPLLHVAWLVKHGAITDLDVQRREQRVRPLVVTLICLGVAWLMLVVGMAPVRLIVLAAALWLQTLAILVITWRWKISVHTAVAAGTATVIGGLFGVLWPLVLGVPLIAWSRVRLQRHTWLQTGAGALLGWAILGTATLLIRVG